MTTIPEPTGLLAWIWQVILHSLICGVVFYIWTRRLRLPSGRTRRRLLAVSLTLPLFTALVPGRDGPEFQADTAWFDGGRVLALPLFAGLHAYHLVIAVAALAVLATIGQELLPALTRDRRADAHPPEWLTDLARALPHWESCRLVIRATDEILISTDGAPWRPRAILSRGSLARLPVDELHAVLRHENAHWRRRRWWAVHGLFAIRMLQVFNPVALWCFREYCVEVEIDCDADAVAGRCSRPLARALLAVYESSDTGDRSLAALRKRVDILLGRRPYDTQALPPVTEAVAVLTLAVTLPWLV